MDNEQKHVLVKYLQQFKVGWWFDDKTGVIRFLYSNQSADAARKELERCIECAEQAKVFLAEVDDGSTAV